MCGICGWIGERRGDVERAIDGMMRALDPRGPDARGTWTAPDGRCTLGHTRLAILDLDGSRQPMTNEDGSVVVSYNGEIYNFDDLRRWLISRHHRFRTRGDTEVLVHLYEEQGPDMVRALDGMFAFAIYDTRAHSVLLARDPIGIKPLVFSQTAGRGALTFASDTRGLLASGLVPPRLDRRALGHYLHFGYVVHPTAWVRDVRQVEPGQTVVWHDGRIAAKRYYTWSYEPSPELRGREAAREQLTDTLGDVTRQQLVADVPLGSFLSGGIDSTSVSGFAQRALAHSTSTSTLQSFTVRFASGEYDESARARSIASELGTSHTEIHAAGLRFNRDTIEQIVDGLGEPFGDSSALAVYLLCRAVRGSVKVALSGDGGDELFYGYAGLWKQRAARRLRIAPAGLRRAAGRVTSLRRSAWGHRLHRALQVSLADDPHVLIEWSRRWDEQELSSLLTADAYEDILGAPDDLLADVHASIGHGERGGFLEQQMRFHMRVDLPCDCLFKVDRMAMAHGLEVRVPMLANAMLNFAARLPMEGRWHAQRTKEPLRSVAERMAPTTAAPAPKHGFGFPLDAWLRGRLPLLWRTWDLTRILTPAGFRPAALDELVDRYARMGEAGDQTCESRALAARLYDLALLGIWMDRCGIAA